MGDVIKQDVHEETAFPEIDWEKPENKRQKGRLLIVGGSPHGFSVVGNAFEQCQKAGIGYAQVVMPSATKALVSDILPDAHFLPSTISGSFAKKGLSELKTASTDAWATLLAGDFGRNSETALLVEGFLVSTSGKIIITKDAVDFASASYPRPLIHRQDTLIVASLSQLQKLLKNAGYTPAIEFKMNIPQLSDVLTKLSEETEAMYITVHHDTVFVAVSGNVSHTKMHFDEGLWQTRVAAYAAVYWIQHEGKPFKALSAAAHAALQKTKD